MKKKKCLQCKQEIKGEDNVYCITCLFSCRKAPKTLQEEFNEKFGIAFNVGVVPDDITKQNILSFIETKIEEARYKGYEDGLGDAVIRVKEAEKRVNDSWINQPANEHDERIRQEEQERFKGVLEGGMKEIRENDNGTKYEEGYNQALQDTKDKIN